jgi:hypothetical protein
VFDVIEYTDRNAHWNAEASDPYLHWFEHPAPATAAPPAADCVPA